MRINTTTWYQALTLDKAFTDRGEPLSRETLGDTLQIPENLARELRFALENRDIIQMRPSVIVIDKERIELVLADPHMPYHDPLAWETILNYAMDKGITDISLLGDVIDMYLISIFTKVERLHKKSIKGEIAITKQMLADVRARWPKATIRYKQGNHEFRMEKYVMENAEEIADLLTEFLPNQLGLKELDIEYIVEPYKMGKLWHLHGHEFRAGGGVQKVCSKAWSFVHDHFIMGHFHRTDSETKVHIDTGVLFNLNAVGWIGSHDAASYAPLNQYNQGFAIVEYAQNGNFRVNNHRVLCGEIF
jgi:predicted phosphodiesterase